MHNFLDLSKRRSDYARARYAVLPIPYDAATSFKPGARRGPEAIIEASALLEDFDEEYGREFVHPGIATLDPLEPAADGPAAMQDRIRRAARRIVQDGKFLISLGGDHSITSGLVRAVMAKHRKLSVLQIDAHADLRKSFQRSPYNHACAMRRVLELGVTITPVGIRSYSLEEYRFMKKQRIEPVSARRTLEDPDWILQVVDALSKNVYVTIDIDAFDPAFAPGTGTPEPGGLEWHQVSDLLKAVAIHRTIVAADLVEVLPLPGTVQTEFLAAKLIYKLIAHIEANK